MPKKDKKQKNATRISKKIDFVEDLPEGAFRSIFNNQTLSVFSKGDVKLPSYGYQVFVK